MQWLMLAIAVVIGLILARLFLNNRGGKSGVPSWRDGADDGDV